MIEKWTVIGVKYKRGFLDPERYAGLGGELPPTLIYPTKGHAVQFAELLARELPEVTYYVVQVHAEIRGSVALNYVPLD